MKKEMNTKYDFKSVESGKYEYWLKEGFFTSGDISKRPYTIVIPPPNVTGKLHLGHAWDTTLQDIIIRRKRMQGYDALWLPGMDHAGIATQAKIDAKLKAQGVSRYDIGREKFLEVAWEWKKEYADFIRSQWAGLGLSLDYTKERFTLDEGLNKAVNHVFITLYNEGLLYRGERIINWDIESKTALSNIEVEYKDIEGAFYHFYYPLADGSGKLEIATTRPETMFGDTAIMVHPDDERYTKFVGKEVYIPGTDRLIPVISDEYVDIDFGTGVVKVTPAHDPNDFEVGNRHNLPRLVCMNEDGTMNHLAGKYENMDRFACRKQLVKDLTEAGLCPKVEKMIHSVGHSERTGVVVEPRLSKQWFIDMKKLADDVLEMQASDERVEFVPERFNKTLTGWLENIQDWCVSRQLWWGHRIPAWYKGEEVKVQVECPGDGWIQDEDVLDTWFSSALWPFSTLGWPEKTPDLERYFETDCLVTGYDIIFFWVARMCFQSKHFMGKRPFKKCLIHGLIRDEQGRKMSKSLGNGVDPFDMIDKYGCDTLRYFLTTNSAPGLDLRFSEEKMASSWNYINKIWNISRYINMNLSNVSEKYGIEFDELTKSDINLELLSEIDKWIISKFNILINQIDKDYDAFEFAEAAHKIYNFTWDDFASWYVELTKVVFGGDNKEQIINTCKVLVTILTNILKVLHPFMPFVTEEIYQIFNEGSITVANWPTTINASSDVTFVDSMLEVITSVRNIRHEKNVAMSKKINLSLELTDVELFNFFRNHEDYLGRFTNFDTLQISNSIDKTDAVCQVLNKVTVIVPLKELINVEEEEKKLLKEQARLISEVERSKKMLGNPNFVSKAPAAKIQAEEEKQQKYLEQLAEVEKLLDNLKRL